MTGQYASQTSVSVEKSRAEIERALGKYGATHFGYAASPDAAAVMFVVDERQVKIDLSMPNRDEFRRTPSRRQVRSPEQIEKAWEQACRQRWRALLLVIKAKLEAIEVGISEFETEFLGFIVLPNGQTASEFMLPQIAEAYSTGAMPQPMLALESGAVS